MIVARPNMQTSWFGTMIMNNPADITTAPSRIERW